MSKWICCDCNAINPAETWKCHCCGLLHGMITTPTEPMQSMGSKEIFELKSMLKRLEDENDRLRGALEHYESAHYDHSGNACYHDKTASEALHPSPEPTWSSDACEKR